MSRVNMIKNIKELYSKTIILLKTGNFYETYGRDAYIISYLFNYQIKQEKQNNIPKSGFCKNAISKEEKFKVVNFMREFIVLVDSKMDNYPKKDIELKNRIRVNSFDMLELCYEANCTENINKKKETINKIIAKIKVIDFLLNMSYDKQIINQKQYYKFGLKLDDITKYIFGWLNSINMKKDN